MTTKKPATKAMTCRQVLAFLKKPERWHQVTLPKEAQAHVKTCRSCAQRYTSLRATLTVFGTRSNVRTPEAVRRYAEKRVAHHTRKQQSST
ncbi:MAG: hypothetical protein D6690_02930 [Nitrospirae bacterium]|nr:MAG: hypothetical protein D6690_02930 [Nitrospirota bacterium]